MKKVVLGSLFALVASQSVFAHETLVVQCHESSPRADQGYTVYIINRGGYSLAASINENTIAGEIVVKSVPVAERQTALMGAPKFYVGRGFELELMVDAGPVAPRGVRGHLTAEVKGRRVSEEMVCRF